VNDRGIQSSRLSPEQLELGLGIGAKTGKLVIAKKGRSRARAPAVVANPDGLAEKSAARALVRKIATSMISRNRNLWEEVKEGFRGGSSGCVFGDATHMTVAAMAQEEVEKLDEAQRNLLHTHLRPNPNVLSGWTPSFAITGEIFLRASRVAGRW
jgi:hypothetical protein